MFCLNATSTTFTPPFSWEPTPDVFPHGLDYFHNKTGWFQQLHNRYWSPKTTYAKQNGGKYDFIVEENFALPLTQNFWNDLIGEVGLVLDLSTEPV